METTTPGPNQTATHIELHAALEAYEKLLSNRHATATDFLNYGRSAQDAFSAVERASQSERDWLALLKSQARAKAAQRFEEAKALHQFAVASIDVHGDFAPPPSPDERVLITCLGRAVLAGGELE